MYQIYAVFIGLGCLISVLPFIVHGIPLSLTLGEPLNASSNQSSVPPNMTVPSKSEAVQAQVQLQDLEAAADNSGYRGQEPESGKMGLFPVAYQSKLRTADKAPATTKVSATKRPMVRGNLTKGALNFWAMPKAKKPKAKGEGEAPAKASPPAPAPAISPRAGEGKIRTKSFEKTISIPRMESDHMGNWVFNPWGVTFGVLWQDTRMHYKIKNSMSEIIMDTPYHGHYQMYYNKPQTQVCRGLSTIYNKPKVYKWLQRRILRNVTPNFHVFSSYRPIWLDFRRELFKMGRSEACHVSAMDDWLLYNNCAILRNMRMEYLIPKYPLHQYGYYHPQMRVELPYKLI
ncbi:uncharacterized protein [Drosophila pseudoobscura]|uniref:Uncharacterized protein n=1 Tax=Drosophila pseudoobscura pseudoobscura TaxID=46245 RepID=A0A6I8V402_DROPS|nr:uncharacterized protein LOC6898281 [Drosophila pseudoobscura]